MPIEMLDKLRTGIVLVAVLFMSACAKEEPVAPCGVDGNALKYMGTTSDPDGTKPGAALVGTVITDTEGDGIGDDGDDLGDRERDRKKPRN